MNELTVIHDFPNKGIVIFVQGLNNKKNKTKQNKTKQKQKQNKNKTKTKQKQNKTKQKQNKTKTKAIMCNSVASEALIWQSFDFKVCDNNYTSEHWQKQVRLNKQHFKGN